jgi:hypothetical protein
MLIKETACRARSAKYGLLRWTKVNNLLTKHKTNYAGLGTPIGSPNRNPKWGWVYGEGGGRPVARLCNTNWGDLPKKKSQPKI